MVGLLLDFLILESDVGGDMREEIPVPMFSKLCPPATRGPHDVVVR